jgi:Calcineurin-like phosphoesterase
MFLIDLRHKGPALIRRAVPILPFSLLFAIFLLAMAGHPLANAAPAPDSPPLLVSIADVHGDFADFCAILQHVGLIDAQRNWAGGKSTFVQTGDLIDRGPKPREVLNLVMSLQEQASKAGGEVVALLGNHEVMNLMGDLRYVTSENYASFADADSEKRQKSAYKDYVDWRQSHSALLSEIYQPVLAQTEAEWMAKHPLGFIEQREAYSHKGIYGKWLRQRPVVARIGNVIFLHGGISPDLSSTKIDDINARIRREIRQFDDARQALVDDKVLLPFFTLQETAEVLQAELNAERKSLLTVNRMRQANISKFLEYGSWLCVKEDGPLWLRAYDKWTEEEGTPVADKILKAYNATNIVVGHTVQRTGRIRPRFGGKIMLADTGMLSSYYPGGRPSALEISDTGKFTAVYLDQQEVLQEVYPSPAGKKK